MEASQLRGRWGVRLNVAAGVGLEVSGRSTWAATQVAAGAAGPEGGRLTSTSRCPPAAAPASHAPTAEPSGPETQSPLL